MMYRRTETEYFTAKRKAASELNRRGRARGALVCELDEALDYIRNMNPDNTFDS